MRRFNETVLTENGLTLLRAAVFGRRLRLTRAATGAGISDRPQAQTSPVEPRQAAKLVELMDRNGVKVIRVQTDNEGESRGYTLRQIMIYAALDDGQDGWEEERDFILMQDPEGFDVPGEAEAPGWDFEAYCALDVRDGLEITLTVDPAGTVKFADLGRLLDQGTIGISRRDLLIPAGSWREGGCEGYPWQADIALPGVRAQMTPVVTIRPEDLGTASDLCPVAETYDGGVRLYAKKAPASDIKASLALLGGSGYIGTGGDMTVPEATRDTLGGVIVGDGLQVDAGGRLSIDRSAVLTPDDLADEAGAEAEIDKALGG